MSAPAAQRILHLASEYPPARVYGLGRFVHGLARAQAAQGDDVRVLTNSQGGEEDDALVEGVRLHRIAFPNPPRPSDGHGEVLQWNHGVVARLLDRRAAFADVDLVVAHDWLTAIAAREAARLLDRPLVAVVHDEVVGKHAGVLDRETRWVRELEALLVHDANLVLANSAYIARQVVRHYGAAAAKVVAVHGGIDPALHDVAPLAHQDDFRAALAGEGQVLVAYVGRLDPEKGLGVLADAIERVTDRDPRVRFVIAGGGRREAALAARVGERARLLGYVKGEALARLYRAADVVVVPSLYEPFGLVALEAMLAGAAVVVARSGGLCEVVRHGHDGLQVPSGDPERLADAILRLTDDADLRRALGAAGRRRVLEDFTWEVIAGRTRAAYASVLDARPALCAVPPTRPPAPSVTAVIVTRDAPVCAEAALRALLDRSQGVTEVVLLDHGSAPPTAARLEALASGAGPTVRFVRAERSASEDHALLLALEHAQSEHVLVLSDEVEAPPGPEGWLQGLQWLLEDAAACAVSPRLVARDHAEAAGVESASGSGPPPTLAEPRRGELSRAAFLARRSHLVAALLRGEGALGPRLRAVAEAEPWTHAVPLAWAQGEAHRDPARPYAAPLASRLLASVVVVAYDGLELTRECVDSVLAGTPRPFELVLVDNGSRDGTGGLFHELRRRLGGAVPVQVLTNPTNLGYPRAANQGLRAARGRHVVLLNNDARVWAGWLEALLAAAASEPDVGVVTAKVLNLDLTVQSAGGILHAPDGTFTIPGQGLPRGAPAVSARRRVPSAGGPCMLLTRALLERVAPTGEVLDEAYSPGYFEDSDLCLRAREAGLVLLYEPGAEVVHHGKATADLVAREGSLDVWGRFEVNRRRFHARWAAQLAADEAELRAGPVAGPVTSRARQEVGT